MHINIQPIEKPEAEHTDGSFLDVHGMPFYTIQGEGPLTGHPAIFIRLSGCNLQCPQCDTEYTGKVNRISIEGLVQLVNKLHPGPRLVVITGGEPFRQNITPLCFALLDQDYQVQIETNGTLPPPPDFPAWDGTVENNGVWIVVSPKAGKVNPATARLAVAWKYVMNHDSVNPEDGLPIRALDHTAPRGGVARPPEDFPIGAIYLQPADVKDDDQNAKNTQSVIRSCLKHGYTLQLQTHKILNME